MSEMYIPDDLKLTLARRFDKQNGLAVIGRETQTLWPVGGNEYISNTGSNGGQWIEFRIPNPVGVGTYDLSSFFVHFNFIIQNGTTALSKTLANHARIFVADSIESIFRTVETYVGNQLIERIENYNFLETCLNAIGVSDNYVKKFGSSCMAMGLSSTQRTQLYTNQASSTSITFREVSMSVPIRASGLFSPSLQLPPIFGSQFAMLRIELAGPQTCIYCQQETPISLTVGDGTIVNGACSDITNASLMTYKLTQVRATCDVIYYSNEYSQLLNNMLASQRLEFPIKTWDVQSFSLPSSSTRGTFSLSYAYNSVDAVLVWFHRTSELNSFSKCGNDRIVFPTNLSSAQLKIGGKNYPNTPITCGSGASEAFVHLQQALGNLENSEIIGPFSYQSPTQIFNAGIVATNYFNNTIALPCGGDIFYGRNRNETATGAIGSAYNAEFNGALSFNSTGTTGATVDHNCSSGMFNPYISEMSPSSFCLGFNLKKLTKESQIGITSGQDIASGGGLVSVQLEFSTSTNEAYTVMVGALHNRFITVQGSSVSMDY
jgi:hypothetical protein